MNLFERVKRWWRLRQIKRQKAEKFYYVIPLPEAGEFWKDEKGVDSHFYFSFDICATADGIFQRKGDEEQ